MIGVQTVRPTVVVEHVGEQLEKQWNAARASICELFWQMSSSPRKSLSTPSFLALQWPVSYLVVPRQRSFPMKVRAQCPSDLDDVRFSGRSRARSNIGWIQGVVAIDSWSGTRAHLNRAL
jgi:hypothetical protein